MGLFNIFKTKPPQTQPKSVVQAQKKDTSKQDEIYAEAIIERRMPIIKTWLSKVQSGSALDDLINSCMSEVIKAEGRMDDWEKNPSGDLVAFKNYLKRNFEGRLHHFTAKQNFLNNLEAQWEREMRQRENDRKLKNAELVNNLSGIEFENHVAQLLRGKGYDVKTTPITGDQGADLIATRGDKKVIIQAKRYEGVVGNSAVQEAFAARQYYGGDEAWVVTNSTFTRSAKELAEKCSIKLFDKSFLENQEKIY